MQRIGRIHFQFGDRASTLPFNRKDIFETQQVHGTKVAVIPPMKKGASLPEADALITDQPSTPLLIKTADCLPIVLADTKKNIVALIHAGWRGLTKGIIESTIEKYKTHYDGDSSTCSAIIGPSLCSKCAVFSDPYNELPAKFHPYISKEKQFDLKNAAKNILASYDIDKIEISPICTKCEHKKYFSYRHNRNERGRNLTIAWIH